MKISPLVKEIAAQRILRLFELAKLRAVSGNQTSRLLARRYLGIARRISSHYKVTIPKEVGKMLCKGCGNLMVPGVNCTVRIVGQRKYVVYKCECGSERHSFYG